MLKTTLLPLDYCPELIFLSSIGSYVTSSLEALAEKLVSHNR